MQILILVINLFLSINQLQVQCAIKTCYKDQYTWTFDKYCIEANDHTRDWNSARAYCRKRGGDLIEIRSREMQTSVEMNLKKKGHLNVAYWIGATDSDSETHWHWLNGDKRILFSKWAAGEGPGHNGFLFGGLEDCAQIRTSDGFRWSDGPCAGGPGFHYAFLCQYELNQVKTTSSIIATTTLLTTPQPLTISRIPNTTTLKSCADDVHADCSDVAMCKNVTSLLLCRASCGICPCRDKLDGCSSALVNFCASESIQTTCPKTCKIC